LSSVEEHHHKGKSDVRFGIVTVSTSRASSTNTSRKIADESGDAASSMIRGRGFRILYRKLVTDDIGKIRSVLLDALSTGLLDVLIFLGGTGVAPSDVTPEAVDPLLEKRLPGFGEIFRIKSTSKIGSASITSRAMAGTSSGVIVFCLPGAPDGVVVGMEIILEEASHLVSIARGS
jgi:molybdenum cofactor biosynthesis protein B